MHSYTFLDLVSHIDWSFDSNYILIGIQKRGLAYAKSLVDNEWNCKIDEGLAGLAHCRFGATNTHILTVSEFKLRLTVWSLLDKTVQFIKNPKHESKGLDFSQNGKLMAVAQRSPEGKDVIGLYDTSSNKWEALHHFSLETFDLEDLKFSGEGTHIIVWDTPLKCKLLVYSIQFS